MNRDAGDRTAELIPEASIERYRRKSCRLTQGNGRGMHRVGGTVLAGTGRQYNDSTAPSPVLHQNLK